MGGRHTMIRSRNRFVGVSHDILDIWIGLILQYSRLWMYLLKLRGWRCDLSGFIIEILCLQSTLSWALGNNTWPRMTSSMARTCFDSILRDRKGRLSHSSHKHHDRRLSSVGDLAHTYCPIYFPKRLFLSWGPWTSVNLKLRFNGGAMMKSVS